ncbi:MAG: DUF3800 domain-containing protein [Proteobacteria bacterium]|nr:DUF3800 domain-containing protein [Pseudomonadota bacterium]
MPQEINIYCDESCHLEHDHQPVMLFGAVWCPKSEVINISSSIRDLKKKFNARGELKWIKVSPSRIKFYLEIIDYFFSNKSLNFRALVVEDKSKLDHSYFNQGSHDSFFYKMYFQLLRNIINDQQKYSIYLDMKDTRSQKKIDTLKGILCRNFHDFDLDLIERIQHVRSHESEILQITDFLLGAVSYRNRKLASNKAKLEVIKKICENAGTELNKTTPPWEEKFNIFVFSPRGSTCE